MCRACGHHTETQTHVLKECKVIHKDPNSRVQQEEIFTQDARRTQNNGQENNPNNANTTRNKSTKRSSPTTTDWVERPGDPGRRTR